MDKDRFQFHKDFMRMLVNMAAPRYRCNRPPGPSGAAIYINTYNYTQIVYGFVEPVHGQRLKSCIDVGCELEDGHCIRNIHAEQRAITEAARIGVATKDAAIFSILKPCYACTKHILAAGITTIYYAGIAYDEQRTRDLLDDAYVHAYYIDVGLPYGQELIKERK